MIEVRAGSEKDSVAGFFVALCVLVSLWWLSFLPLSPPRLEDTKNH